MWPALRRARPSRTGTTEPHTRTVFWKSERKSKGKPVRKPKLFWTRVLSHRSRSVLTGLCRHCSADIERGFETLDAAVRTGLLDKLICRLKMTKEKTSANIFRTASAQRLLRRASLPTNRNLAAGLTWWASCRNVGSSTLKSFSPCVEYLKQKSDQKSELSSCIAPHAVAPHAES